MYDGTTETSVSTDAVKFVAQNPSVQDKIFLSTGSWNDDTNAAAYNNNYEYTNAVGSYTASWTASNLDPAIDYNVYVRWYGTSSRSDSVKFSVNHDGGTQTRFFNQQEHSGQWMELATEVKFSASSGTGIVQLMHDITVAGQNKACADAVAFVPSSEISISNIIIPNSHYYTKGTDGDTYLINIPFSHYRLDFFINTVFFKRTIKNRSLSFVKICRIFILCSIK